MDLLLPSTQGLPPQCAWFHHRNQSRLEPPPMRFLAATGLQRPAATLTPLESSPQQLAYCQSSRPQHSVIEDGTAAAFTVFSDLPLKRPSSSRSITDVEAELLSANTTLSTEHSKMHCPTFPGFERASAPACRETHDHSSPQTLGCKILAPDLSYDSVQSSRHLRLSHACRQGSRTSPSSFEFEARRETNGTLL